MIDYKCKKCGESYTQQILSLIEELEGKVLKIISNEPSALIPRTQEHLEAYRKRLEIRNEFREEIKNELKKL